MRYSAEAWPGQDELKHLVRAAQRDEPGSLDELLVRLRPPFLAFFAQRVPHDDAEDLAQDALLRVARSLRRIDPERADRYVVTIACNLVRSERQRRVRAMRRFAPIALAESAEDCATPEHDAEQRELVRAVRRAGLATLPPELRDIVIRVLGGLSPSEVAAQLDLNPVTVRTRLLRARTVLRRELRAHLDTAALVGVTALRVLARTHHAA